MERQRPIPGAPAAHAVRAGAPALTVAAFGPGDRVRVIDAKPPAHLKRAPFAADQLLTVARVAAAGLALREVSGFWRPDRFALERSL